MENFLPVIALPVVLGNYILPRFNDIGPLVTDGEDNQAHLGFQNEELKGHFKKHLERKSLTIFGQILLARAVLATFETISLLQGLNVILNPKMQEDIRQVVGNYTGSIENFVGAIGIAAVTAGVAVGAYEWIKGAGVFLYTSARIYQSAKGLVKND